MSRRNLILSFIILSFALLVWADKDFTFVPNSTQTPAAAGKVTIGTDRNGNNAFDVKVFHLSDPAQLTPAKTVYIVWAQENGKAADNLGQLKTNHDLEGSFHGTTPYKHFD